MNVASERNHSMWRMAQAGHSITGIAAMFQLSPGRTSEIIKGMKRLWEKVERGKRTLGVMQLSDDLDRKWSGKDILDVLAGRIPTRAANVVDGAWPTSLRNLLDLVVPHLSLTEGPVSRPRIPLMARPMAGVDTWASIVNAISAMDLGYSFNALLAQRKPELRKVLERCDDSVSPLLLATGALGDGPTVHQTDAPSGAQGYDDCSSPVLPGGALTVTYTLSPCAHDFQSQGEVLTEQDSPNGPHTHG